MALQNRGMTNISNLDKLIQSTNSCPIEVESGSRGGIRISVDEQNIDI